MRFDSIRTYLAAIIGLTLTVALAHTAQAGLMAADATPNSITLTWTAPGDDGTSGTATTYDVRYSTSNITEASWNAAAQASGEPTPHIAGTVESFTVTGLTPSTTYYFAVKAADEMPNWSGISNIAIKTTAPEDTPPANIANVSVGSFTSTGMTVSWTAPGDDGSTGTASTYDIRYATFSLNASNWDAATIASNIPAPATAGTNQSLVISGLTANTTYYVAIKTADEVPNWSGISNVASGTTLPEATPPAVIANLGAVALTQSSVILSWTAPGDDGNTGTASQYDVRYSTSSITAANFASATQASGEPTPHVAGTNETFVVTGLNVHTTYYFAMRTADEVPNWSSISNVTSATTLNESTPPANVANLGVTAQTSTSLTLSWTAPGDDGSTGTASQYDLRYSTSTITTANWASATQASGEPTPASAGTTQSCTISGLQPDQTYYFALMTADEVPNWSGLSNVAVGSTSNETTPPAAIANLGVGVPTEHSLRLNWTAPGDDGNSGTASAYDIRYALSAITEANWASATQAVGEPSPKAAGSAETFTVSGLNSNTTYYFAIKTADEVPNWSAISNSPHLATSQDATAPSVVSGLIAVQPTLNSLTLVWTAPGDDGSTGQAAQYDIRFSTSAITTANWSSALQVQNEPTPKVAGTPESLTVTGLSEHTTYYFALRTADEVPNWSAISNVVSNSTASDATPPATINDLSAVGGNEDGQIELGWTAPGDDGYLGRATAYFVRYYRSRITTSNWDSAMVASGAPQPAQAGVQQGMTLSGLVPGQYYYVAVRAIDDALNMGSISNTASAEATLNIIAANEDMAQPEYPPVNAVLPTAQPELVVRNANDQNSNVYRFELATDSAFVGLVASALLLQQPGGQTSWKIPVRLAADQDYFWRVETNGDGFSSTLSFAVEPFTHAYPNPVRFAETEMVTFTDLSQGDDLMLVTISGSVVRRWSNVNGSDIQWDGTNESGNEVGSGTYLWYASESGAKGKLLVVR